MAQHEFRTLGVSADQRLAGAAARTPTPFLSTGANGAPFGKYR
jgi:hypothetical protein